jgi:Protein of unknown function (DUF3891)
MVLFPITAAPHKEIDVVPAWRAVEERQRQSSSAYWVVTQPSHAALAGDIASALREDLFGAIDGTVARSIALHDSGWSMDDAAQIQTLRADAKARPVSFVSVDPDSVLRAWTGSIDTAERFAAIGGYIVSRHFERLSQHDPEKYGAKAEPFRSREKQRQQRLRATLQAKEAELERLVDALQFCDLLSLYLCCGSTENVFFNEPKLSITRSGEEYRLEPSPFREPRQFSFSALRHPAASGKKEKAGATFYINL